MCVVVDSPKSGRNVIVGMMKNSRCNSDIAQPGLFSAFRGGFCRHFGSQRRFFVPFRAGWGLSCETSVVYCPPDINKFQDFLHQFAMELQSDRRDFRGIMDVCATKVQDPRSCILIVEDKAIIAYCVERSLTKSEHDVVGVIPCLWTRQAS